MSEKFEDPFGTGRLRRRLSEEQTAERMLAAGSELVYGSGLRVSFDLLSFEDVIVRADVARSAAYKRWPRKEMYYSDLFLQLAGHAHPARAALDLGTLDVALGIATDHPEWLHSAAGRRRLAVEMCRLGALQNFEALHRRPEWQPYMALHATLLALPPNEFRMSLQRALGQSESNFAAMMGSFYKGMLELLGYRLRRQVGDVSYDAMAVMGSAAVMGMALTSGAVDDLREQRFLCDPFGVGELQDWSYPGLAFCSIVMNLVEPDPEVLWDAHRLAEVERRLDEMRKQLTAASAVEEADGPTKDTPSDAEQ